jgi:predicted RNA binding protein YcfA (HicA-like mRNA interferase family)
MKLSRDISGQKLAQLLRIFEYKITRQTGSHLRLTTMKNGEHHITIPTHNPLRTGTLSAILSDVAEHVRISREELIEQLRI